MAPTEGRVARPERRWGCRRGTPAPNEETDVAQNRPLWRLMYSFGAMHTKWRLPQKKKKEVQDSVIQHGKAASLNRPLMFAT